MAANPEGMITVRAAELRQLADAMDDLWAAMRETSEDRSDLSACFDYLFARAGLVAMRCSSLVERGRGLREEVITRVNISAGRTDKIRRTRSDINA